MSTYESYEKARGRIDNRKVSLYENRADHCPTWKGIQRLVKVRRWGIRKGKEYDYTSYYILSRPINHACLVAKYIRSHWGIENNLHWIKDVLLKEDLMPIQRQKSATNVAILNTTALNLLRLAGHKPNADSLMLFTNNIKELYNLLAHRPPDFQN